MGNLKDYLKELKASNQGSKIYKILYDDNVYEEVEDNRIIFENASSILGDKFHIYMPDYKMLGTIFYVSYNAILDWVISKVDKYSDYQLSVCDRLVIGFSNRDDEEDEKVGNIALEIVHLDANVESINVEDPSISARERCVRWTSDNIINQPEEIRNISIYIEQLLKEIDIRFAATECIMPVFITTYEALINYARIKRFELNKYEFIINFISCFYLYARETEEGEDEILIKPSITDKLAAKNDAIANSVADDGSEE